MNKIITVGLSMFLSFSVYAQDRFLIAESDKRGYFYLLENSFTKTIENDKELIGITIGIRNKGETEYYNTSFFKMNIKNCMNKKGELLHVDSDNNKIETLPTSIEGDSDNFSLPSTFAYVICKVNSAFEKDPTLYETTLQTIRNKIIKEKSYEWKTLWSDKTISYLPKYIQFEGQQVTVPILIQKDSDKYFKALINKEQCRDEVGFMEIHNLAGEEFEGAAFDLNETIKQSAPHIQELAIEMCKYTMANHKFKKKIVINGDGSITRKDATN